jgi:hypothetical protein
MLGCLFSSRWLVVLWATMLLCAQGAFAATHTQTVALKVQGMV